MEWMKTYGVKTIVLALLVTAGGAAGVEARGRNLINQRQANEIGERNGYECGFRDGRADRRHGNRYNDHPNLSRLDNRGGLYQQLPHRRRLSTRLSAWV